MSKLIKNIKLSMRMVGLSKEQKAYIKKLLANIEKAKEQGKDHVDSTTLLNGERWMNKRLFFSIPYYIGSQYECEKVLNKYGLKTVFWRITWN